MAQTTPGASFGPFLNCGNGLVRQAICKNVRHRRCGVSGDGSCTRIPLVKKNIGIDKKTHPSSSLCCKQTGMSVPLKMTRVHFLVELNGTMIETCCQIMKSSSRKVWKSSILKMNSISQLTTNKRVKKNYLHWSPNDGLPLCGPSSGLTLHSNSLSQLVKDCQV